MTTIVEALNRIARQCSVSVPSSWAGATRTDHVELRDDFLLETIDDILERIDLPSPIGGSTTITGTGAESYNLPDDFKRLHRSNMSVYDKSQDRAGVPISTDGEWQNLTDLGVSGTTRYYRLSGYEGNWVISFVTPLAAGTEIVVSYSSLNWLVTPGADGDGEGFVFLPGGVVDLGDNFTASDAFTSNDDVLLLPRRAVEAGTVWRYRERRGLPYQDKYNEYEILLARLSNDTRGRRVVNFGGVDSVRWQDNIPAFIPAT